MNRKGELTTKQLVTLIVLIASFVVILLLLFRLNLGQTSDKEICRNSVVLKDKTAVLSGPINCKTSYVCISGGDGCTGGGTRVSVRADNKTDIMKAITSEMSDCWYEFAEGKAGYGDSTSKSIFYALCSTIEFDQKVQEKTPAITYAELYNYLKTTQKEGSQSYLNYLYGTNEVLGAENQIKFSSVSVSKDTITTSNKYSVITGIDNNIGFGSFNEDQILPVSIIPTSETSTKLASGEFITKA